MCAAHSQANSALAPQLEQAVLSLERELDRSPPDPAKLTAAIEQLYTELSTICPVEKKTTGAIMGSPSGPVIPKEAQPDAVERALRKRLTQQTHRPAGPPGSATRKPSTAFAEPSLQKKCMSALELLTLTRSAAGKISKYDEEKLLRLRSAIRQLRKKGPP
jgi:hypothetical protein